MANSVTVAGLGLFLFGVPADVIARGLLAAGAIAMVVVWAFCARCQLDRFEIANQITLGRAVLAGFCVGFVGQPDTAAYHGWLLFGTVVLAALLDGVDGWVARRTRSESAFGARFDMEIDAAFVLVLSILVYQLDKAGAWVLLSGLLRYLFIAAGFVVPRLRATLPPSIRRRVICAIQVAALVVCLAPAMPSKAGLFAAAGALVLLTLSFGRDVAWLLQAEPNREVTR